MGARLPSPFLAWHDGSMTLDTRQAAEAIEEYFGSDVLTDEPTWAGVLIDQAPEAYESAEDLTAALDLMHLRPGADH
jgi:hypothetical protein